MDKTPQVPGWEKDSSGTVEVHQSGDTMSADISMSDGNHKVYLIISQDGGPAYGVYGGQASFDGKTAQFNGIDYQTVQVFDLTVKGNIVTTEKAESTTPGSTSDKLTQAKDWIKDHWKWIVGIASTGGLVFGVVLASKKNGRRYL